MKMLVLIPLFLSLPAAVMAQGKDTGGQPDWVEQAKIVAQMEGISVGEAIRRGKLERRLADQVSRLEADPNYAGSEIVRDKNQYRIVHYFNNDANTLNDSEIDAVSDFRKVRFSMRQMKDFQKAASKILFSIDASAYSTLVPSANRVRIFTIKPDEIKAALGSLPEFVEFESGGWFTKNEAAMKGGGAISGASGSCTAGFNVRGSVTGVSTASHCVPYMLQTYQGVSIGTHRGPTYQSGATTVAGRDFTWYRNDSNTYSNAVKYQTGFYTITSVSSAQPSVNTPVCLLKQNDIQSCAYVSQVAIPPGGTYPAVILDRDISTPGDSGGPWFYTGTAYGIHQGKKCDDAALTVNCKSLYSPAANMPAVLGVSVITQ